MKATRWARKEATRIAPSFDVSAQEILKECQEQADKEKKIGASNNNIVQKHHVESWAGSNCNAGIA